MYIVFLNVTNHVQRNDSSIYINKETIIRYDIRLNQRGYQTRRITRSFRLSSALPHIIPLTLSCCHWPTVRDYGFEYSRQHNRQPPEIGL